MTTISLEEFKANPDKYFDMAMKEYIVIQRGDCDFLLTNVSEDENEPNDEKSEEDAQPSFASSEMERIRDEFEQHLYNS